MSEIITTNQIELIAQDGAMVLENNKERTDKALTVGNNILSAIKAAGGLNPELDQRANKYLVNCRTAKKEMEEARKPLTQFFDQIKKEFTGLENNLDISKQGSIPFIIQSHRNDYVRKLKEEEDRKRKEAELKLNKEKEAIEIRATIETQFSGYIRDHITSRKQLLQQFFNSITLDNFQSKVGDLKSSVVYHKAHLLDFNPSVQSIYLNVEDVRFILNEFSLEKQENFDLLAATIEGEITAFQNELIEKLPSLKNELNRLKKANDEERSRLEAERKKREEEEHSRLEAEADEQKKKQEEEIQLQKEAEKADAIVNNMELFDAKSPETRSGFQITILHQAGAVEIFNFWFQREGANCTIDEIERKSISQMKTFCERVAHKDEEFIDSKYLKYEPVYKAVNRK